MTDHETPASSVKPSLVFAIIGVFWLAAAIALSTVEAPGRLVIDSPDPTPRGYTWSLGFFLLPLAAIATWLQWHHRGTHHHRAFWLALALLIPLGFGLDIVFGLLFFTFENVGATLGVRFWALDWQTCAFVRELPIEEFGFYGFGFAAILAGYVWCDLYFLDRYASDGHGRHEGAVVRFSPAALVLGIGLTIAAILYKKFGDHPYRDGFPGWMVFLIWIGVAPAVGLYRSTAALNNWRALTIVVALLTLISLIWEATLAVPYGWWGYVPEQMVGVFIGAWSGLPIEQPVLWVMISFTAVIVFETVRLVLHKRSRLSVYRALFGGREREAESHE